MWRGQMWILHHQATYGEGEFGEDRCGECTCIMISGEDECGEDRCVDVDITSSGHIWGG